MTEICRAFDLFEFGLLILIIIILVVATLLIIGGSIRLFYLQYKAHGLSICIPSWSLPDVSTVILLIKNITIGILGGVVATLVLSGCFIGIIWIYTHIKSMFC